MAGLVLSACSDSGAGEYGDVPRAASASPGESPSMRATATPSAMPSASATGVSPPTASASPTPGATARSRTPEQERAEVIALAREYFEESARASQTGDTKRLRSLSTADCPCLDYVQAVEDAYQDGRMEGFTYTDIHVKNADVGTGIKIATVVADTPAFRFVPDSGPPQEFPGGLDQPYIVSFQYKDESLIIIDVKRVVP